MRASRILALALIAAFLIWNLVARSTQAGATDASITAEARIALINALGARHAAVRVETTHGRITLYGKVGSEAEKEQAAAALRGVDAVTGVRNRVEVVGEGATPEESPVVGGSKRMKGSMAGGPPPE